MCLVVLMCLFIDLSVNNTWHNKTLPKTLPKFKSSIKTELLKEAFDVTVYNFTGDIPPF